jgi:hypothetical protein
MIMNKQKVTYRTKQGLVFNTLINAKNENEAIGIMTKEYLFSQIEILKVRPSVKQKYAKVCNYRIK